MDWRAAVAVIVSTLLLIFDSYRTLFRSELWTRTLLYLGIPLLIILLVFRESPSQYGFRLGNWRAGLVLTVAGCALMTVVAAVIARTGTFTRYYGRIPTGGMPFWLADGIELLGWEFFFRGFLLFALYRCCGPIALFLQAVPFAMAHIGKPELETLSCIFGGAAFGYVAWRTDSALYPFLIHWFQAVLVKLVASGAFG
jgi:membrane protease YdiL (CAAX protease family)